MTRAPDFSPRGTPRYAPPPAFDPKCCIPGCSRDGTHGEQVRLRKGQEGMWWCWEHYRERMKGRGVA